VDEIETKASALTALIKAAGGRLESQSGYTYTFRVPVAKFQDIFAEVLKTGEVISKNMSAQDLTESFSAVELRVASLTATRDRLIELLAKAKTEAEKIELVKEIQQVSEQLDQLEAQKRLLSSLADESRLTVELVERAPMVAEDAQGSEAFAWIAGLSPFTPTLYGEGKASKLPIPTGMVRLTKNPLSAEGPDGARIRATRIPNEPRGDAAFWLNALEERLKTGYTSASEVKLGSVSFIRVEGPGREEARYRYLVGVYVVGKELEVVELYFPTPDSEARYKAALEEVLMLGGV
jgi:hypothetical protein